MREVVTLSLQDRYINVGQKWRKAGAQDGSVMQAR